MAHGVNLEDDQGRDLSLTPNRADVLDVLVAAHKPLKAYDILSILNQKRPNIKPPTVYRALDFLTKTGRVHHLQSLQMYAACELDCSGKEAMTHHFLVCDECGEAKETVLSTETTDSLRGDLGDSNFTIKNTPLVFRGQCSNC